MKSKVTVVVLLIAYVFLLVLADLYLRDYHMRLLLQFGLTAIVALGVNLTNGYTNIFSLGFGGTMLVAGYTTALLTLPLWYKERFLEHFNGDHDIARNEYQTRLLDAHKLAALSILAVKKALPLSVWYGGLWYRENAANDLVAIMLAQDIMLNYRIDDYKDSKSI